MKLGDLSTRRVVSVAPNEPIERAIVIMEQQGVHHLPVLSAGQLVGMVSDRDILLAGQEVWSEPVETIMSQPVVTLSPDDVLRSAIYLMINRRLHAIPLIRNDRLVGIVTDSDLLGGVIELSQSSPPTVNSFLAQPVVSCLHGRQLITVGPQTSLDDVVDLMQTQRIRHLPVVNGTELLGIVSDRDVRRALGRSASLDAKAQEQGEFYLGPSEVQDVMTRNVRTISSSATAETAIDELLRNEIHSLPVVDEGKLLGILTDTDLLRAIGAADKADS